MSKPRKIAAEKERKAKARLRTLARSIPDDAVLANILLDFPDKPFRREFLRRVMPYLRFTPTFSIDSLEVKFDG